jgi:predicted nucleic acid-binding protein
MSRVIVLDAGPLGILTNPHAPAQTIAVLQWSRNLLSAGNRLVVPAIADYEVRRELERANKIDSLALLDIFNTAQPNRYLPLTDSALRLGAKLWARARNSGTLPADPKELNGDVLIAAQVLDMGVPPADFVIATVNVGHLSLFVPADLWTNIHP